MKDRSPSRIENCQRGAFEVMVPASKPGGKPTYHSLGEMATAPNNDAALDDDVVGAKWIDFGPLGTVRVQQTRAKLPGGGRGRPSPLQPGQTRLRTPDNDVVQDLRWAINNALLNRCYADQYDDLAPHVKVVCTDGVLKTVPDKGMVVRWGSVDDLVRAILAGLV